MANLNRRGTIRDKKVRPLLSLKIMIVREVINNMKSLVLLIILTMFLTSCKHSSVIDSKNDNQILKYAQTESEKELKSYESPRVIIPEAELVYKNYEAGYQITFPQNWQGNYVITEYSPGEVCIGFYGKSKTGRIAFKHNLERDGLDLGWIVSEKPKNPDEGCLVLGKIGEVNGVEYFITTPRGGTYIPMLSAIADPDSAEREIAKYEIDETELILAEHDSEIAIPMRDDLYALNIKFEPIAR